MKILAIDSSAISAGCAIVDGENIIAESFVRVGLTHSETLLPMVSNTLANAKMPAKDIAIAITFLTVSLSLSRTQAKTTIIIGHR